MSLIGCTQDCLYQRDGTCTLDQAAPRAQAVPNNYCVNFTPRQDKPVRSGSPAPPGYF